MANEQKPSGPVVIDAATFSPAPANTFRYSGKNYPAYNLLQVRRGTRNRFAELDAHLKACGSPDEQTDLLAGMIKEFAPSVPLDSIRDEPLELLIGAVLSLGNSVGTGGEPRPTKGRRKSSKLTKLPS